MRRANKEMIIMLFMFATSKYSGDLCLMKKEDENDEMENGREKKPERLFIYLKEGPASLRPCSPMNPSYLSVRFGHSIDSLFFDRQHVEAC